MANGDTTPDGQAAVNGNSIADLADEVRSATHRAILGSIGGILPVFTYVLRIDPSKLIENFVLNTFLGYCVQAPILASIGGFVAYISKKETNAWRLVVLGISAPALIVSALNANSAKGEEVKDSIAVVKALPPESASDEFLRGLFAVKRNEAWFVVEGTYKTEAAASDAAKKLNALAAAKGKHINVSPRPNKILKNSDAGYVVLLEQAQASDDRWFVDDKFRKYVFSDEKNALASAKDAASFLDRKVSVP